MKKTILQLAFIVLAISMVFISGADAAIINSASCSQTHVQAAITSASTGDTVVVPACAATTWTVPNSYTPAVDIPTSKKITLQAAGIGNTTINIATNGILIRLNESGSRVTGFTFINGYIKVSGKNWRIDHNRFVHECTGGDDSTVWYAIQAISSTGLGYTESVKGLIDRNEFHNTRVVANGGPSVMANEAWGRPLELGTDEAVYVEDNNFTYDTCTIIQAMDANYGGAYVFRYNNVQDASIMAHAVQGANRAARKWEVYNNKFYAVGQGWTPGFIRAGTGVWFNNALVGGIGFGSGKWSEPSILLDERRSCGSYETSGQCDGSSPWDGNQAGQNGYPCRDQIGRSTDAVAISYTSYPDAAQAQTLDPTYSWNNYIYPTEADRIAKTKGVAVEFVVKRDICEAAKAHLVAGRDFVNNRATPKPGYTPYTYPHPLTSIWGTNITEPAPAPAPAPPQRLRIVQ